jgi:hypothetical protein
MRPIGDTCAKRKGMGVKQQRRRERHDDDEENAEEEGGYNNEEEGRGGGYNDNKERHARSRKVGDRYNDSKEELGHNDKDREPSTHSQVPRHIQYTLYYL